MSEQITAQFAWHVHHGTLVEPLVEPIEVRREYIRTHKPKSEQELRLRLLHEVEGELPPEVVKAGQRWYAAKQALDEARQAYHEAEQVPDEACQAYTEALRARKEARRAYLETLDAHMDAVLELHDRECPDCPWDGHTIFPDGGDASGR